MKMRVQILIALSILFIGCAGPRIATTSFPRPFSFQVIDSSSLTKDELYVKANEWMAKTFNSAKEVIQMNDKTAGKLIGKGIMEVPVRDGYGSICCTDYVSYTISIDVKDKKYRCVMSDYSSAGGSYKYSTDLGSFDQESAPRVGIITQQNRFNEEKQNAMIKTKSLLNSLKTAMNKANDGF